MNLLNPNPFKTFVVLAISIFALVLTGCHKDAGTNTGSLKFHMHTVIGDNEVDSLGELYPDANGRPMSVSVAQFYMSNISVKSSSGTWYTIPGTHLLKRIESEDYFAGTVPAGDYTDVRFDIGLDSTTNATDPTAFSTTGPDSVLSTNESVMWLGWPWHGHAFMLLKGQADISVAHDGSNIVNLDYTIASNVNLRTAVLPTMSFSVLPNQFQEVHLYCDYGKLLQGIDLTDISKRSTDTYGTYTNTATLIADSIPFMFRYE